MATFTYTPDFGASKASKPRVKVITFGDGYEQRLAYGINTNPQEWNLTFSNRNDSEAQAIDAFLTARNAVESFSWTPYGESPRNFVCREWSKVLNGYNRNTIEATFIEVFEL
jgi:phage-related protein